MGSGIDHTSVFHSLQEPVLLVNTDYRICEVNQAFCRAYDIERDKALGRFCYEVTHRYSVPCSELGTECPLKTVAATLEPYRTIHKHVLPDGTARWEEVTAAPLLGSSGSVEYVIEELRDVSELLRTREIMEEMKNEMKILKGILPMCSRCHKIRDQDGNWHRVDTYIGRYTEAGVSHGLCPECGKILYPEFWPG